MKSYYPFYPSPFRCFLLPLIFSSFSVLCKQKFVFRDSQQFSVLVTLGTLDFVKIQQNRRLQNLLLTETLKPLLLWHYSLIYSKNIHTILGINRNTNQIPRLTYVADQSQFSNDILPKKSKLVKSHLEIDWAFRTLYSAQGV